MFYSESKNKLAPWTCCSGHCWLKVLLNVSEEKRDSELLTLLPNVAAESQTQHESYILDKLAERITTSYLATHFKYSNKILDH